MKTEVIAEKIVPVFAFVGLATLCIAFVVALIIG